MLLVSHAKSIFIFLLQVSELKRVNNLIREQDFFALRVIKVPVKRHGLVREMIEQEQMQREETIEEVHVVSITGSPGSNSHMHFLQQMDKDISKIVSSTRTRLDSLEKVVEKMTCKSIQPLHRPPASMWTDCTVRWNSLMVIIILVALVTPLFYVVYYKFVKPQQ